MSFRSDPVITRMSVALRSVADLQNDTERAVAYLLAGLLPRRDVTEIRDREAVQRERLRRIAERMSGGTR